MTPGSDIAIGVAFLLSGIIFIGIVIYVHYEGKK
jgi:hypothetical protein